MLSTEPGPFPRSTRSVIRTPDQRVRVFVSSTLGELANERAVVRNAIGQLRLSPVMFELGARPHPPRALYRAYLAQSHVFLGVYWQSYGWISPNETVSGIEDEYDAAGDRPKLIYVKDALQRDPRLEALLRRIERDEGACYKPFSSADELRTLVEEDLALLLSERFEAPVADPATEWRSPARAPLPSYPTTFVGREKAIRAVRALFARNRARIVTLTGPGGIGKTRLALEVARGLASQYDDGVLVVLLAALSDPAQVVGEIAETLRLETANGSRLESVVSFLRARKVLLVLDNFEHVMAAAPVVSQILRSCPRVRALVTSREVLRVSGEHGYEVEPLEVPRASGDDVTALRAEAVQLFCERAVAAAPTLNLNAENVDAVADICRGLDGLPLAIELAAARARVLPIEEIRARLHDRLGLLVHGPRDAPERQRTLRATIAWSHELLSPHERRLFARLAAFHSGWGIRAAEAVCACKGDVLEALSSLLEKSLVRSVSPPSGSLRFEMLETIREFALRELQQTQDEEEVRGRHAEFFLAWITESSDACRRDTRQQGRWVARVAEELENLRAAMRWFLARGRPGQVAVMGMALWDFWWIRSHLPEAASWMEEALASGRLSERERAMAQFVRGLAVFGQGDYAHATEALAASHQSFRRLGEEDVAAQVAVPYGICLAAAGRAPQGEALLDAALATFRERGVAWQVGYALLGKGRVLMMQGRAAEALAAQEEGAARMRRTGELMIRSLTLLNLGWGSLVAGRVERAAEVLAEALGVLASLQNREGLARALEAIAAISARRGNAARGALLLGAAEGVRRIVGARPLPLDAALLQALEANLRGALDETRFRTAFEEGLALPIPSAVEIARALVQGGIAAGGATPPAERGGSTTLRATGRDADPPCPAASGRAAGTGRGYCGLDCGQCAVFIATTTRDDALRRRTAREWSARYGDYLAEQLGRREFTVDEISCDGCRSSNLFIGCSICAIRACAIGRGLDSCADCAGYSACRVLNAFYAAHPDAKTALDAVRAGR